MVAGSLHQHVTVDNRTHAADAFRQPTSEAQDQLSKMYIDVAAVARRVQEAKESLNLYLNEQVLLLICQ